MKRYIRLFKYDFKNTIRCNYLMFIFTVVLAVIGCMYFKGKVHNNYENMKFIESRQELKDAYPDIDFSEYDNYKGAGIADYQLYMFRGMDKITKRELNSNTKIEIPVMFIGMAVILSFMTGKFLFKNGNYTTIVRTKSRPAWILSKLICNMLAIAFVYIITAFTGWIFSNKEVTLGIQTCKSIMGIDRADLNITGFNVILIMVMLPCLSAIAVAQMQIMISLAVNEIAAFVVSIGIYIFSVFYKTMWLPASGCMVQRFSYFMDSGFDVKSIVFYDIILIIVCVIADIFIMRRKNILD